MKIYTNPTKIGLLIGLLSFNTLFACVNTKQKLGINLNKLMVNGLHAISNVAPSSINSNQTDALAVHKNSNTTTTIALPKSTNNHTSTIPSTSTGLPYNMTIDNAANILNAIEEDPTKLVRNKRGIASVINIATAARIIGIPDHIVSYEEFKKAYLEKARSEKARLTEYLSDNKTVKNLMFIQFGFADVLSKDNFSLESIRDWLNKGMNRVDPSSGCSLVATLYAYKIPDVNCSIQLLIDRGKIDRRLQLPYWAIKYTHCPHQQ